MQECKNIFGCKYTGGIHPSSLVRRHLMSARLMWEEHQQHSLFYNLENNLKELKRTFNWGNSWVPDYLWPFKVHIIICIFNIFLAAIFLASFFGKIDKQIRRAPSAAAGLWCEQRSSMFYLVLEAFSHGYHIWVSWSQIAKWGSHPTEKKRIKIYHNKHKIWKYKKCSENSMQNRLLCRT